MQHKRWTYIDEMLKKSLLLESRDTCFYYLTRINGGFSASEANSRIDDFKKKPERFAGVPYVWKHKLFEIERFADDLAALLGSEGFVRMSRDVGGISVVPMPTSKPKSHPYYDSRIVDMCNSAARKLEDVEVDDAFDMSGTVVPSHEGGSRDIGYIERSIMFDGLKRPDRLTVLVDDVLCTGSHYIACRNKVLERHPDAQLVGAFLALHKSDYVTYDFTNLPQ